MEETVLERRKAFIKNWLHNPFHLGLLLLLLVAMGVHLYYFSLTEDQTLWWDEAEYMATAKHWAFNVPYELNEQRPPLFQILAAFLLSIGLNERLTLLLLVVFPSISVVLISYILAKELFNQKIGLITAFGMTFTWSYLFWSVRFQPDFLSISFQLLSVLFFWKTIIKKKVSSGFLTGLFIALGFYFKISTLIVPLSLCLFLLITEQKKMFTTSAYYAIGVGFIVALIPFFIWQYTLFGNPIAFAPSYADPTQRAERDFGWQALTYIYSFHQSEASFVKGPFAILALIGFLLFIIPFLLTIDTYFLSPQRTPRPELLAFSIILCAELFYIFWTKGVIEDRWIFIIAPFLLMFSALGLIKGYSLLKERSMILAWLLVLAFMGIYTYAQIQHADSLITLKKDSYSQIKEASLFIKEQTLPADVVLSVSYTQTTAYAERKVVTYAKKNESEYLHLLSLHKPRYILLSIYEPHHPPWLINHGQTQEGGYGILMPYFNASILIGPNNAVTSLNMPQQITHPEATYTLVYPKNSFNGVFVYQIKYSTP
jgi:hypothetical protein